MKTSQLFLGLLLSVTSLAAQARLTDNKVQWSVKSSQLKAKVTEGFHFNIEAPASIQKGSLSLQPQVKKEKDLAFNISKVKGQSFDLSFYVCDDANTVCEEHSGHFKIQGKKLISATKSETANNKIASSTAATLNHHGFIENNLSAGLTQAAAENKKVLVDFGAPWCPSCVRMETEVFGEEVFQTAAKDFIKVAINVDKASMKELSKKYTIHAIPTVLILNAKGEELYRLLDYKPADQIAQSLNTAQKMSLIPLSELTLKAEGGDKEAQRQLAERSFNAMQFAEAARWYAYVGEKNIRWATADINAAEANASSDEKKTELKKTLEKWIALFPTHYASVGWREQLAQKIQGDVKNVKPETQNLVAENLKILKDLNSSSRKFNSAVKNGEFSDIPELEKVQLTLSLIENYKLIQNTEETKKFQKQLIEELNKLPLSVDKPGMILSTLYYYRQADRADLALEWLTKLQAKDPATDVYEAKMVSIYMSLKNYEKALPLSKNIIAKNPDRKLGYMKQLAEIQKNLQQRKDALATIKSALKSPEAKMKHNEQLVKAFKDMQSSL